MAVAEVLEFEPASDGVEAAFDRVIAGLRSMPVDDAVARGQRFQNRLAAVEAELVARRLTAGETPRGAEKLLGRGGTTTSADAKSRAKRARAVEVNPELATDVASGALGLDALDALAEVSAKTEGAAAVDDRLITRLKAGRPDDARTVAREWLDEHTSTDEHEARWQRQRRQRRVTRFVTRRGLDAILAEGDTETIAEIWTALTADSKQLYNDDGGRDLAPDQHPRTRDHRMFDALHTAITGGTTIVDTGHATSTDGDRSPAPTRTSSGSRGRPQVFITMTIDDWISDRTKARLVGGGTIPASLLDRYLTDADVAGVVFDRSGHILWHGRNRRYATAAQTRALVARDHGCVLCHAHPSRCHTHHLTPYNAPDQGNTNTDDLALVCDDCHHHLHHNHLTLVAQPHPTQPGKLTWTLRPATPNEIPP